MNIIILDDDILFLNTFKIKFNTLQKKFLMMSLLIFQLIRPFFKTKLILYIF